MSQFTIVDQFLGYESKREVTNQSPGVLIKGSKNVVSTDGFTIGIRQGYTEFGTESTTLAGIIGSFEWQKLRSGEIALRSYTDPSTSNGVLQFYWSSSLGGDGTWKTISNSLNSGAINFTTWYDQTTEKDDHLLFVDGSSNMHMWSGGIATFASATANTITKEGSGSWAESGFLTNGTRRVVIDGTAYTYTGGESTTTLTGVTPNPTLAGHAVGELVYQQIRTSATTPASGFSNDVISVLENQVFVGSLTDRQIYVSKASDYTDYTFSSPRLPAEGALFTLDAPCIGFDVGADAETGVPKFMNITAGGDFWYKILFTLSADLTNESITVIPLKNSPQQGAKSQSSIGKIKNATVFITNENTLDEIGRIENITTPNSKPLSDRVKTDFDSYDFTNSHIKYYKNNIYITVPVESLLLVYNLDRGFWEAPWDLPAGRLAIIDGDLILHSNSTPSSYKLFDGYSDNGNPINGIARFSYMNYGDRANYKDHSFSFLEGRILENTTLTRKIYYELDGGLTIDTEEIEGSDTSITFASQSSGSIGKTSLGKQKIGSGNTSDSFRKFRVIHGRQKESFFEHAFEFSSNEVDYRWEIISFGSSVVQSSIKPIKITK